MKITPHGHTSVFFLSSSFVLNMKTKTIVANLLLFFWSTALQKKKNYCFIINADAVIRSMIHRWNEAQ